MLQTVIRRPKIAEDIATGVRLARMHGKEISPATVARTLRLAKVRYVLVGAHATNGYTGRPRTTVDVDVIVQFPKKAAKAIAAKFPKLQVLDTPVVIRFMDGDTEAIDLMKPIGSKLWARLLKETRKVLIGDEQVHIPVLEGVLAGKFAAMVSIHRRHGDKLIDAGDLVRMVEANEQINLDLLRQLGDLVYDGGGEEIVKLVADARAGRRLEF
jgi:hypothetical protein